jgi:hypothetical protein
MPLTGKFTFRRSFWGRIVLQVEEEVRSAWPFSRKSPTRRRFRDANLMDLAAPELRTLIDLRQKPRVDLNQYYYTPMPSPHRGDDEFDGVQPSIALKSPIAQGIPRTTNH